IPWAFLLSLVPSFPFSFCYLYRFPSAFCATCSSSPFAPILTYFQVPRTIFVIQDKPPTCPARTTTTTWASRVSRTPRRRRAATTAICRTCRMRGVYCGARCIILRRARRVPEPRACRVAGSRTRHVLQRDT
ncbi:hypothetical protein C8R44DRAFT_440268, partial [Mycena epipterygia]